VNKIQLIEKIIFGSLFLFFLIMPLAVDISIKNDNQFIAIATVNASETLNQLNTVGVETRLQTDIDLTNIAGKFIRIGLEFLGIIAIIIIIIGGIQWMTSGGAEEKTTNARGLIVNALIGLVIVLMAYVITVWVIDRIQKDINLPDPPPPKKTITTL